MGQIGRLPVERSHTGCYGTGLFGREVVCQCMGQLGRLSIELSRTGGQSIGLFDQIGRLPVERSRTGCRIGRMLPGVLRCLGRLFRLVGAIAFPPFVPVAEEEDVCCTADNLWGLSPLFGEYGCSVSAVSVSTDCRTGRSVKEKQTVRSAVSGNASKILNFDRRFCLFRAIMIRRFLMSE